jgi:predicted dehydrogenase
MVRVSAMSKAGNLSGPAAENLKIAVVGGGYGRTHLAAFEARPDVEVVAICCRTRETAESVGRQFDVPLRTTSFAQVLALDELDAVAIASPVQEHSPMALAAIDRGCHVLCEKPLALSSAEAEVMLHAAEAAGIVHATNFDWRYVPDSRTLNRLIREGGIGTPRLARFAWLSGAQVAAAPWCWRHHRAECGFGVLGDFHHVIDEIHWHFGSVHTVMADLQTAVESRTDVSGQRRHCDAEDTAAFIALTRSGVQVVGYLSRCAPQTSFRVTECFGSEGHTTLMFPDLPDRTNATLTRVVNNRTGLTPLSNPTVAMSSQDAFVRAIHDRTSSVETSFFDGLAALRFAEALREASDRGRSVALADDYDRPRLAPTTSLPGVA